MWLFLFSVADFFSWTKTFIIIDYEAMHYYLLTVKYQLELPNHFYKKTN